MAIDIANAGAAVWQATSSLYVSYPASVDSDQFLLMQVSVRDTTTTPTVSASWTNVSAANSTLTGRQWLYYRWGTTTMGGSSSTVLFGAAVVCSGARIYGFKGVATASTIFEAGQYMTSNTTSMTCGEVTCTVASYTCLGVAAYHVNDDNDVGVFAGMVGATWAKVYQSSTTLGSDGTIGLQVATITTSPVTVTTASYSMAAADPWGVLTFLLIGSATVAAGGPIPVFMFDYAQMRI